MNALSWLVLLLLLHAEGYSPGRCIKRKYYGLIQSQSDSSDDSNGINDMELIYGGANVSVPVTFGDFINRSLYWTSDWDISAGIKISTSKTEGLGLQQLEKHVIHNVPTVRAWTDPESPENLKKFTEDISILGTLHPKVSKIHLSNHSVGLKVIGVKNSWKKSNFRSNHRANLNSRHIAIENNMDVENVEKLVVIGLSEQLLTMALNEPKHTCIADKGRYQNDLHKLVVQLYQAKKEYLHFIDNDTMKQLTSALFRLCERKKYFDSLNILIESELLHADCEDRLVANLGSLSRIFSSLYSQRKYETVCRLYSLPLHLYLVKRYNESLAAYGNTLIEIGSLSRLWQNKRFNILETLFQFNDNYLTSKSGEAFIVKILGVYARQKTIDASLFLFNKLIAKNITIGSTVVGESLTHSLIFTN